MSRRPNRIVLLMLGLLLVAAGAGVLLAAAGILAVVEPGVLYERLAAAAQDHPEQWAAGLTFGALLVALFGIWLVRRQLKIRRGGRLSTVTLARQERGRTSLQATAVTRATAADLRGRRGVVNSHVRMVTFGSRPRLLVSLSIDADTEPRTALGQVEEVYERVCRLLGKQEVHVDTVVQPTAEVSRRVQ